MISRKMTPRLVAALFLGTAAAGLSVAPAGARSLVPAEERYQPFAGAVPACDDPAVLSSLQSRFAGKEANYWSEDIHIVGFDDVRQTGLRNWGMDHIPRRYCAAIAITDETAPKAGLVGRVPPKRKVIYNIIENGGFAGYGWGVEFCVQHHDHNAAYAPACRAAGP